jgi:PTH1 family peptidyl-tRNA hydrolase
MRSVVQLLGQMEFPRVRVGIGEVPAGWEAFGYVLGKFEDEEAEALPDLLNRAADCLTTIITKGMPAAMNTYNKTK